MLLLSTSGLSGNSLVLSPQLCHLHISFSTPAWGNLGLNGMGSRDPWLLKTNTCRHMVEHVLSFGSRGLFVLAGQSRDNKGDVSSGQPSQQLVWVSLTLAHINHHGEARGLVQTSQGQHEHS